MNLTDSVSIDWNLSVHCVATIHKNVTLCHTDDQLTHQRLKVAFSDLMICGQSYEGTLRS